MTSDEIREQFLSFFEARGHRRLPSFPLVPADEDRSVLFTIAGMNPLKPYFLGREQPPHRRLTDCQKCFRTVDIEVVGTTARHLTFFEMLGNFSIGDYFKEGAVEFALELSLDGFGFSKDDIWVTVFEGDEELGIGPDEEAAAIWERVGIPRERIVPCPRSENWWQSGPTGPCGPCSELYLDRGVEFGRPEDRPGEENERFLEYWNLVFMQFDQDPIGTLTPLPAQHIDTGLGLNRMALIQQGVPSIFETDQFVPLMALGRELATRKTDERALRILADHSRAMTFLIGDGVVPSNEDRGYVLRRIMRRAIQQGHRIGIEPGFLPLFIDRVVETMGAAYPEVVQQRATILKWARAEEESFGRTLEQGTRLLDDLLAAGEVSGADAFRLHDTYGFPVELTRELAAERGVPFGGEDEFGRLMEEQRARSRASGARGLAEVRHVAGPPTRFVGYETLAQRTTVSAIERVRRPAPREAGRVALLRGGRRPGLRRGRARVRGRRLPRPRRRRGARRRRPGACRRARGRHARARRARAGRGRPGGAPRDDVQPHRNAPAARGAARDARRARPPGRLVRRTRQAALRLLATSRLSPEERRTIEDQVNAWVLRNDPVRPITTTLDEARALGAMALFGEKYGDVVRMVEIGDGSYSRELCGGTHVRSTAEIGVFKILSEGSSASNVRRIEAITGPGAVRLLREEDATLRAAADALRTPPERVVEAVAALQERARQAAKAGASPAGTDAAALAEQAAQVDGATVLTEVVQAPDARALLELADRVKGRLAGDAAIVLGTVADGRVHLVASVAPGLVERGLRAGQIVKEAAQVAGGGGGGRDTMAQAGGRDPEKLEEAIATARRAIVSALG